MTSIWPYALTLALLASWLVNAIIRAFEKEKQQRTIAALVDARFGASASEDKSAVATLVDHIE